MENSKLIYFAPDKWGTLEKFQKFCAGTYKFPKYIHRALSGSASNFCKANILLQMAVAHSPKLKEDKTQLREHGYTPAQCAKELSALIEAILLNLYSSIDCTRKVVTYIYKGHRGVKDSTRKFFKAIQDCTVSETVPAEIRNAFMEAHWYTDFREIRDHLTHSDIGSCSLNERTGKVFYMHAGLGTEMKALVIEDIFAYMEALSTSINKFIGKIFNHLNETLDDVEVWQICGIFGRRIYTRWVRLSEAKDFNSGRCDASKWLEKSDFPDCPFMQKCEAFEKRNNR